MAHPPRHAGDRARPQILGARVSWLGHLSLHYTRDGERTIALDRHHGPLRVLRRLYPEGPGICHHVLVHPPGGMVGGDVLEIEARLEPATHALITTPGATRFYRSEGATAAQHATLHVAAGARLEWLPLETIAHTGCQAHSRVQMMLAPGAEMIGWELLALGLPARGERFERGSVQQHLELPGVWLERARIAAADTALLDSPLGWAGQRVLATMWFAAGSPLAEPRRERLLAGARAEVLGSAMAPTAGASAVQPGVVVLRALAGQVEPAMQLLQRVRAAWRHAAWALPAPLPRVWRT